MRRNSIFLRNKLSEKELFLLKKDLVDNSVYFVSKIKNLTLFKPIIEEISKKAVERVLSTYKFGSGGSLGDLVKIQVMADLRAEFEKAYPDQANKVIWPNLAKRAPFEGLLETLQTVKLLPVEQVEDIFEKVNNVLNERQQKLLGTVYSNPLISYAEISKQYGKRGVMTYKQIQIIYNQVIQILKETGINL